MLLILLLLYGCGANCIPNGFESKFISNFVETYPTEICPGIATENCELWGVNNCYKYYYRSITGIKKTCVIDKNNKCIKGNTCWFNGELCPSNHVSNCENIKDQIKCDMSYVYIDGYENIRCKYMEVIMESEVDEIPKKEPVYACMNFGVCYNE